MMSTAPTGDDCSRDESAAHHCYSSMDRQTSGVLMVKAVDKQAPRMVRLQRAILRWSMYSPLWSRVIQCNVLVLRWLPFLSLLVVFRRAWRLSRLFRRMRKPFGRFVLRTALESWALMELWFWLFFRWKKRSLESRRAFQPSVLQKAPGERLKLLHSFLSMIEDIHRGTALPKAAGRRSIAGASAAGKGASSRGRSGAGVVLPSVGAGGKFITRCFSFRDVLRDPGQHEVASVSSGGKSPARKRLINAPSVENFLRYCDVASTPTSHTAGGEFALAATASCSSSQEGTDSWRARMRNAPSVENLLRCWEGPPGAGGGGGGGGYPPQHAGSREPEAEPDEPELRYLKHLELCSWFRTRLPRGGTQVCRDVSEIRRGNIEEWLLSYWFDGADNAAQLSNDAERAELQELVDEVVRWAGLPNKESHGADWLGKNPGLQCFRMRNDPFPAVHRPLFVYSVTALAVPFFGNLALSKLGFRPYRAGSMEYWLRLPTHDQALPNMPNIGRPWDLSGGGRWPLVFCHGIGVGPTMCFTFLQQLTQRVGKHHPIFLVDTAAISMRFSDDVPGAREYAANMVNMLEVWGFKEAHFVGHSFGSFLLAWMLRYQRSYVERCTFLDPVCFLLLKVLNSQWELQQVRSDLKMNAMEMGIKYFVLTELFVCNFVCRCFFWEESHLDMAELEGVLSLVVLESDDLIVPSHSVRRLALAERDRRKRRRWAEAFPHEAEDMPVTIQPSDAEGNGVDAYGLEVLWVEEQPHAGFLVDAVANLQVNSRLEKFHSAGRGM